MIPIISLLIDDVRYLKIRDNVNIIRLFNIHAINDNTTIHDEFDMILWINFPTILYNIHNRDIIHSALNFSVIKQAVDFYDNKFLWKQFMMEIGLEHFIPKTYKHKISFPCVLKTNEHNGHGVTIIKNKEQLKSQTALLIQSNVSHYIEEALLGMGTSEMTAFGSVFNGELLSLRCGLYVHDPNDVIKNSGGYRSIYVRGYQLRRASYYPIGCSREVIKILRVMFQRSLPYTGLFCADLKADHLQQIKIMEVNTRLCRGFAYHDELFISAVVTLSYAILQHSHHRDKALPAWFSYGRVYDRIRTMESRMLQTGGGIIDLNGYRMALFETFSVYNKLARTGYEDLDFESN